MAEILPLQPGNPSYRFGTSLSGTQYLFDVRWNARDEAWYFDILAEDETVVRQGIKITLGALLGGREVSADFPPGIFQAHDQTGEGVEPGLADLGERVVVAYYAFTEFE